MKKIRLLKTETEDGIFHTRLELFLFIVAVGSIILFLYKYQELFQQADICRQALEYYKTLNVGGGRLPGKFNPLNVSFP